MTTAFFSTLEKNLTGLAFPDRRILVVAEDQNRFEQVRAHCPDPVSGAGAVHWLGHYETARDALFREAYDVVVLDSRHHGLQLLREMARGGTDLPAVVLMDIEPATRDAAGVTCVFLARDAIDGGRLSHAIHEVVERGRAVQAATRSQTWWRSGGSTLSHAIAFPTPPEIYGNVFMDAAAAETSGQLTDARQTGPVANPSSAGAFLGDVLDQLPVIAGRLDEDGTILECGGRGLQALGLSPESLRGKNIFALPGIPAGAIRRALRGTPVKFVRAWSCAGKNRHFECHLRGDTSRPRGLVVLACDVTERMEKERARDRRQERALLHAVDAERQRIGADLHDEVGQLLTGIACLSAALANRLREHDELAAEDAATIAGVATDALAHTRTLAHGLIHARMARGGLTRAIENLRDQIQRMHGVDVRLNLSARGGEFDHETAAQVFRIVQQAVANAVRHGQATQIDISVTRVAGQHRVAIRDNGRGFDAGAARQTGGSGLGLMEYRAALIGANLNVTSNLQLGTTVEISIPPANDLPHEDAC